MTAQLPSAAAVVFDCDGLLLDTEPLWGMAERAFVVEQGGTWSDDLRRQTHGRSIRGSASLLAAAAGASLSVDEAEYQLVTHFEKVVARHEAPLMPGAVELLDALCGTPLAVASNSPDPLLERLLARAGARDRFHAVVGAGGRLASKPAPDVYLAACRALNVDPIVAHALEDSQPGVDSAAAAGLTVTGVNDSPEVRLTGCRRVSGLHQLSLRDLAIPEQRDV